MAREPQRIKKRERKNISAVLPSQRQLQQHDDHDHRCPGQRDQLVVGQAPWASRAAASRPLMPHRLLQKMQARRPPNMVCRTLEVEVKGPGSGRKSALRALQAVGFTMHLDP